jgi:chromosome segregation ATPase
MQKLHKMETLLGGAKKQAGSTADDAFVSCKEDVLTTLHWIRSKQKERTDKLEKTGRNVDVLKITAQIGTKLPELEKLLDKMNIALRAQRKDPKKYSSSDIAMKEKVYNNLRNMFTDISQMEKEDTALPSRVVDDTNTTKLSDLNEQLLGNRSVNTSTDRGLTDEEATALEKFKQKDNQMDELIGEITQGLYTLKDKSEGMGGKLDQQRVAMDELDTEIGKATNQLESSNAKLKKILEAYRSPSKFCMDVVLLLMLLGLAAVIYNMINPSSSDS